MSALRRSVATAILTIACLVGSSATVRAHCQRDGKCSVTNQFCTVGGNTCPIGETCNPLLGGFCLEGESGKNAVGGPQLNPNTDPPFVHFDLREFGTCAVPYSYFDGTTDLPGTTEFDEVDEAFATWSGVGPSVITFQRVLPGPGAKCPLEKDAHNMLGWNGGACATPGDDVCITGVGCACGTVVGAGAPVIGPGPDGYITSLENDCPGNGDDVYDPVTNQIRAGLNGRVDTRPNSALPAGTLALTANFTLVGTGRILESDILFNDQFDTWVIESHGACYNDVDRAPLGNFPGAEDTDCNGDATLDNGFTDVRTVALHEIGHFFGLHHTNETPGTDQDRPPFGNFPGAEDIDHNGNGILDTPSPIMDSPTDVADHTLSPGDVDGINFLYTPDLGDAPDVAGNFNHYPSFVRQTPATGRMLNGQTLNSQANGAEHLFGLFGPDAVPRFQYEWLGTSAGRIDDSVLECEARVVDKDRFDDGVTFAGAFPPGGAAVAVTVEVRTSTDIEGRAHDYAAKKMFLNAWFDWNADNDWDDPGEHVIGGGVQLAGPGANVYMIAAPAGARPGGYARFRLDWGEDAGQLPPTDDTLGDDKGAAQLGEVEDYPIPYCLVDCRTRGRFGNGAQLACDVAANDPGGSFQLGKNVFMADGTSITGDLVKLGQDTSVWSLFANTTKFGAGAIVRDGGGPPVLPFLNPFPSLASSPCSGPDVTVLPFETLTLPPGSYGRVRVAKSGTLTLEPGGVFNFCSLRTTREAAIFIGGADQTVINIVGALRVANASVLQPLPGVPGPFINVAGTTIRVGRDAELDAFVTAPNAIFRVGRAGHINGSFIMKECGSDKEVVCGCETTTPGSVTTTTTASSTTTTTLDLFCCEFPPGALSQPLPACLDAVMPDVLTKCDLLGGTLFPTPSVCDAQNLQCVLAPTTLPNDFCCECPEPSPPFPHPTVCYEGVTGMEFNCPPPCVLHPGLTCSPVTEQCVTP